MTGAPGFCAAFRLVGHDDEGGFGLSSCADGLERSHAEFEEFCGGVDFAAEAGLGAHGGGTLAEDGGGEDVAGLVDEGAGEVLRACEDEAFCEAFVDLGASFGVGFGGDDGEGVDGGVFAVALVDVVVDLGEFGAFDEGAGHEGAGEGFEMFVVEGVVLGEDDGELAEAAWFECAYGGAGTLAYLVDGEALGLAEADYEQALCLEAVGGV